MSKGNVDKISKTNLKILNQRGTWSFRLVEGVFRVGAKVWESCIREGESSVPCTCSVFELKLVRTLPDVAQTNGGVKAKEDGEWCGDVSDDGPSPKSVEVHLNRI